VVADQVITTLGSRLTLGIEIDPLSTASNVILWVSHSSPSLDNGVADSSTVSRLSGTGFTTRTDVITGLPRAIANHAINAIHFGPDGKLYIAQGGNTGAGAPNTANTEFGTREEQPLSAAILVADVRAAGFDGSCHNATDMYGPPPCDVKTYATGLRNAYDFVFHSNGSLYAPDNGLGVAGS
jgi:glucose/arabinose dehydrogenase